MDGKLRVSMSYHRFPNMREYFQKDLNNKLLDSIPSLDFQTLPCKCRSGVDSTERCKYNDVCKHKLVV
jgi:hypothetical protein